MDKQNLSSTDTLDEIDLASGYLEETEKLFWNLSKNISSPAAAAELNTVVEHIWEIQNKTSEIQQQMLSNDTNYGREE
jgi:CRISPR/Cas system-associated protein Csm6